MFNPIGSMYGIFTYIWRTFMVTYIWRTFMVNVGKYAIQGTYGNYSFFPVIVAFVDFGIEGACLAKACLVALN